MVGGLRPPPADAEAAAAADAARGVVFVLEGASLETAKVGKVCGVVLRRAGKGGGGWERAEGGALASRRPAHLVFPSLTPSPPPTQSYVLLNCDDHATFLRKHRRDPAALRPDIAHQALLALLDSPLAKAGKIKVCEGWCVCVGDERERGRGTGVCGGGVWWGVVSSC